MVLVPPWSHSSKTTIIPSQRAILFRWKDQIAKKSSELCFSFVEEIGAPNDVLTMPSSSEEVRILYEYNHNDYECKNSVIQYMYCKSAIRLIAD